MPRSMKSGISFAKTAHDEVGTIYEDAYENDVRFLIMRGPVALCVYIGIPVDHPLAGFEYDDIPLDCHGGLTFSKEGGTEKDTWPAGWWWYGYDYAHSGDRSFYDFKRKDDPTWPKFDRDEKEWTVDDVREDIWNVTYEFSKLRKLAERIVSKRYEIREVEA